MMNKSSEKLHVHDNIFCLHFANNFFYQMTASIETQYELEIQCMSNDSFPNISKEV